MMRIRYNAPVTLTFALVSTLALLFDNYIMEGFILNYLAAPPKGNFTPNEVIFYIRILGHTLGHADWNHLINNIIYILLLGPILEERFGSLPMFIMFFLVSLIDGMINVLFMETLLVGASGIVFMMMTIVSIVNIKRHEIPLSLLLVLVLYMSREVIGIFRNDDISQLSHILGGLCGVIFGFIFPARFHSSAGAASLYEATASASEKRKNS